MYPHPILLLSLALTATASPTPPRPIFTLPPPPSAPLSWFESLAVRPSGLLLATRGDAPEIWQIDPVTRTGALLVSVAGAFNLTGIAEIPRTPCGPGVGVGRGKGNVEKETYIFASSHIPAPLEVAPGSAKVWKLMLPSSGPGKAEVSLLAALPEAGFLNGVAAAWGGRVLLGDTLKARIYAMDAETGDVTTLMEGVKGVNGVQVDIVGGWVYWASHAGRTVNRVRVKEEGGGLVVSGEREVVVGGQTVDDFAVDVGRGRVYVAAMGENEVVEVGFGEGGGRRVVAEDVSGTGTGFVSVVVLGRGEGDKGVLYVAVGQDGGGNARVVAVDVGSE